jgi:UDP-GlcNAc:undecaprenyl-phosphate GlcNAc-1-phosphate transferase
MALLDLAGVVFGPLVIALLLTALLIRWAPALRLVDLPDVRKAHAHPTPKVGGIAVFAALVLMTCSRAIRQETLPDPAYLLLLGAGLVIVVLGLADDLRNLSWQIRLSVQTLVAVVTLICWPHPLDWPVRMLGVLWVVGMTNAFNMLDNMDALSPGTALIASAFLAATLVVSQPEWTTWHPAILFLMVPGALAGFLWFNRPPARAFLGDAGSTFLGFVLGIGSLDALGGALGAWPWTAPVCLLAVPCYDMTSVVLLRLRQGRSPFHADRQHLSHRLVRLGLRPSIAVSVIHLMGLASGAVGLVVYRTQEVLTALLVTGGLMLWWAALAVLEMGSPASSSSGKKAEE